MLIFLGQDNLHCGPNSPAAIAASDITALLPSNEDDFANGKEPETRAALEGTPPANVDPTLALRSDRSLFATLIQAHQYWGMIARRAMGHAKASQPWDANSEYGRMVRHLKNWERCLPKSHRWSLDLWTTHKL